MRTTVIGVMMTALGVAMAAASTDTRETTNAVTSAATAMMERPGGAISDTINQSENLVRLYNTHITTLASPFFEGRAPGLAGDRRAADYVEFYMRDAGLEPGFTDDDGAPSFRQAFRATTETIATNQFVLATGRDGDAVTLKPGADFNPLNASGNGVAAGPLAFVGYSIEDGPDGYSSYGEKDSLEGKIALMLRFEPMNDEGQSRFSDDGRWTGRASFAPKLTAAAERGAEAIIIVAPPGVADPRAGRLPEMNSFRGLPQLDVPLIFASRDAVDRMLDGTGTTLMDLRTKADEAGGVETMPVTMTVAVELERRPIMTDNVGGILRGSGDLADEYVVIGAHYDHVGYGFFGSRSGARGAGIIHPGADDNASGTSGVLILAKLLSEQYAKRGDTPRRSIFFQAYGAEEMGLIGSRHHARNPITDVDKHHAMINLDMIGWLRDDRLEIYGTGTATEFDEMIARLNEDNGLDIRSIPGGSGPSDHAAFYAIGIPVLFLHTGLHPVYHMPADVADLINREGAIRVVELAQEFALELAMMEGDLEFVQSGRGNVNRTLPAPVVNVRFGVAPGDYSGSTPGILLGDVFEGTSAAEAGLKAGDVMITWNGNKLDTVESWMPFLGKHKPGDKVVIEYLRDGERRRTTATLKARDEQG